MGQVCFTAISSNRACPTVFIALSSVFQIIVLCACCPSVQWLGAGGGGRVWEKAGQWVSGLALREEKKKKKKGFVTPTETNLHGDALCFMGKTWARHKTTEAPLSNGSWLVAVGGWRLLAVGGGRLVVLRAVLKGLHRVARSSPGS